MREAVRAILLTRDNKSVIVGKRTGGIGGGQWALFGGKPDLGESNEQAAIRETKEETNLEFINPRYFTDKTVGEWHTTYYFGNFSGEIKLDRREISAVKSVTRRNLGNLDFAFGHEEILKQFFAREV